MVHRPNHEEPELPMSATIERPTAAPSSPAPPPPPALPPVSAAAASKPAAGAAPRPNRVPVIVLGSLALVALVLGVGRWRWGLTHVSTDDAQVEGHMIPTLARVAGYVTEVAVSENQQV